MERKSLKRYRELRAKIVRLDKKIAKNTYLTQDIVRSGGPKRTTIVRGLYNGPELRALRQAREECFSACREVEEFIQDINDPLTQEIFEMRYFEGLNWRDIAQQIGGGNSEDSVKKKEQRLLKAKLSQMSRNKML